MLMLSGCATWEFSCGNICVPVSAMCDGVRDCVLGEDEEGCGEFFYSVLYLLNCTYLTLLIPFQGQKIHNTLFLF